MSDAEVLALIAELHRRLAALELWLDGHEEYLHP
jgi:hypothetical protein